MPLIPLFVQLELDAGDTDLAKRLSAFNFSEPFDHVMPFSDGTISALDRQHLWGLYTGIPAATGDVLYIIVPDKVVFPFHRNQPRFRHQKTTDGTPDAYFVAPDVVGWPDNKVRIQHQEVED